jgi:streptogramin lyase
MIDALTLPILLPLMLSGSALQWPPAPASAVVSYVDVIDLGSARPSGGFWKKMGRWVGGGEEGDRLAAPFDIVVGSGVIWMTCSDVPGLVRLDPESLDFSVFGCEELPVEQAIALAELEGTILMTDSERGVVYRLEDERLRVWLDEGLSRPTGLAVSVDGKRIWIADTGVHQIVEFDRDGQEVSRIGSRNEGDLGLNYPTFLAAHPEGDLVVNDTLNYRVKRYTPSGELQVAFGDEGSGPGRFVRAKGIAATGDGRILVVDGMQDQVQVLSDNGTPIVQIGRQGEAPGTFWSPTGIDVLGDLIYVADTHNHRIQILRLAEPGEAP